MRAVLPPGDLRPATSAPERAEPVRLQRSRGALEASFAPREGRTRIARLHQSGALKLRMPRLPEAGAQAIVVNTAGGLAGGDRLRQGFRVEPGGDLTVASQACERAYASLDRAEARIETHLHVGEGAVLRFLPQETILFHRARLRRTLCCDLAATGRLVLCESAALGREAMGEVVREGLFADRWRIRRDGRLVFAEDLRLSGDLAALAARPAVLAGARAFATVLWTAADGPPLGRIRDLVGERGGASEVEGFGVARLVAPGAYGLRARLVPLLALLSGAPLPRVWTL